MSLTQEQLDEIYAIGVRNGGIFMRNKILQSLNRDFKLFRTPENVELMVKIMKKINRLKIPTKNIKLYE